MYRSARRRSNKVNKADDRLKSRANSQSEFTQMAYLGGENGGGKGKVDGINPSDAFGLAKS